MTAPAIRKSHLRTVPATTPKPRAPRKPRSFEALSIVQQVKLASAPRNRLACFCGMMLGGIVPVATYYVAHVAPGLLTLPALITVGGLCYSAPTVYGWGKVAFGSGFKACGFVLLLEGVMVSASSLGLAWLGTVALGYLVAINAIASACRLVLGKAVE